MLPMDRLINQVNGKGKYQVFVTAIISSVMIFSAHLMTSSVFQAAFPASTRCRVVPYDNHTLYPNATEEIINEIFIPYNAETEKFSSCKRKIYQTENNRSFQNNSQFSNSTFDVVDCPDGYAYDKDWFTETIVTEWDLVCDRSILSAVSTSFFYVGVFFGSVVGGIASDMFGRLFVFRWGCIITAILGCAVGFAPNLIWFVILRLSSAVSLFHAVGAGFTYVTETSKTKWRVTVGLLYNFMFGLGCASLGGFAYFWTDWRHLQFALSLVGFVPLFIVSWFLPESPRWLLSRNKLEEAKSSLVTMARRGGSRFPEEIWSRVSEEFKKNEQFQEKSNQSTSKDKSILNFFQRPYTRYLTWSNMYVWMITSLVYYGLILTGGALPGSIFVNNLIGGLSECFADLIAIPCVIYLGCTVTTSASLFVGGSSCLLSTLVLHLSHGNTDIQTVAMVLSMIGRFSVSMAFATIYLHTVEMFPTVGRTTAFGLASMAARVGGIFSPFTSQAQYNIPWLSPVIYGITAFTASLFASTFPDTRKTELTTTFDETEEMFENHLHNRWPAKIFCLPKPDLKMEAEEVPLHQDSKA